MKYLAYGSNLNVVQMMQRCPLSKPLYPVKLDDWQLVFRGYADIIPVKGEYLYGAIWDISNECEIALDRYEGVKGGLYSKKYFNFNKEKVLWYKMNSIDIKPPDEMYYETILEGYNDFSLPDYKLKEVYERTLNNEKITQEAKIIQENNFCGQ